MIAFATAEEAIEALCDAMPSDPYDETSELFRDHLMEARDRVLSDLTTLRAENARLRAVVAKADAVITPGLRYRLAKTELEPKARLYCEARAALDSTLKGT